jgi:hypothetical protein
MHRKFIRGLAGAALALLCSSALGQKQWEGWDYTYDREILTWSEMQAQLPAYPVDENLIPLNVGAVSAHRYFIDGKSVSTGGDGVARYTMVIKTSGGATNISFEGMRCESREQKYYAIGRGDKTWARARNPQWRPIDFREVNAHHMTLYREYLCRGKFMIESPEQIVRELRAGPQKPVVSD